MPPMVETHLANTVLTNGARYYVDHAHPEYSTPECVDPLELVVHDKAGEEVLRRSMAGRRPRCSPTPRRRRLQEQLRRQGQLLRLPRELPHGPGRPLRQGRGRRRARTSSPARSSPAPARWAPRRRPSTRPRCPFQISQRAEFFEEVVGLETTLKRPDRQHPGRAPRRPRRFRRLHVIVGDANLSEVATFLKVGTTALVLAMIEDDAPPARDLTPADPVRAIHQVSADLTPVAARSSWPTARPPPPSRSSGSCSPPPASTPRSAGSRCSAATTVGRPVLDRWEAVLHGLETDPADLGHASSTGWPSASSSRPTGTATAATGTTTGSPRSTCSTTTCGPSGRSTPAWAWSAWSTDDDGGRGRDRAAPPRPGPGSGASAWPGGPRRWSPPTGTRWSSTSARTRSAASL